MKSLISCLALFAGALGAQPDAFQIGPHASTHGYSFFAGPLLGGSYLGVNLAEIDGDRARELKLKETYGAEITRVAEGSPAEQAGLKFSDVVLEYNGQRVEGMEQLGRLVRETPAGRQARLLISRNGATQTIAATVESHKLKNVESFKE